MFGKETAEVLSQNVEAAHAALIWIRMTQIKKKKKLCSLARSALLPIHKKM